MTVWLANRLQFVCCGSSMLLWTKFLIHGWDTFLRPFAARQEYGVRFVVLDGIRGSIGTPELCLSETSFLNRSHLERVQRGTPESRFGYRYGDLSLKTG